MDDDEPSAPLGRHEDDLGNILQHVVGQGFGLAAGAAGAAVGGLATCGIPLGMAAVAFYWKQRVEREAGKLEQALLMEQYLDIFEQRHLLEENMERLAERDIEPSPADVQSVANHFDRVWRSADPTKRKVLKAAFARAFDPELYESGLITELFKLVEDLSYGDLRLLAIVVRDHNSNKLPPPIEDGMSAAENRMDTAGMGPHHLRKLHNARLLLEPQGKSYRLATGASASVLMSKPSALGLMLQGLVGEGLLIDDISGVEGPSSES